MTVGILSGSGAADMRTYLLDQMEALASHVLNEQQMAEDVETRLRIAMAEALEGRIRVMPNGRLPAEDEERWNALVEHRGMVVDPTHNITTDRKIRFCYKSDVERLIVEAEAKR